MTVWKLTLALGQVAGTHSHVGFRLELDPYLRIV